MGSFPHTLLQTPKSANVTPELYYWPTPFHAFALVVSPKLGSQHMMTHMQIPQFHSIFIHPHIQAIVNDSKVNANVLALERKLVNGALRYGIFIVQWKIET